MSTKDEKILCAANWYPNLQLKRNDFPMSHLLPVNIVGGIVFCGHQHLQCLYQMIAMTGLTQHEAGIEIQGFLTNKNRFVNRKRGAELASKAGQIINPNYNPEYLFSEDLY